MFACFYFCVFQKHAFFSCFFSYSCTTSSFPVLSLPFLLFCFCLVLLFSKFFNRASIFTFLHFLKLLAHPFLQPPVTFHIYLCFSSSYLFLSLRSGNWGHIWPSRTWTLQQSVKQPCRSTMFGTNRAGIFRLWKVCLLGSLTMRVVRETPGSHMSLQV